MEEIWENNCGCIGKKKIDSFIEIMNTEEGILSVTFLKYTLLY